MSNPDPKITLRQIEDHILWAQELCTQTDLCGILTNWQKRLAFERVIQLLGDGLKRLPPDLAARHPAAPWSTFTGLSEQVTNGQNGIEYAVLWNTMRKEAPSLLATVRQLLAEANIGK